MAELLTVEHLDGWYGQSHVLRDVSLTVHDHEMVALLGRNGVGKTTLILALMGLLERRSGSVRFGGQEFLDQRPHRIARAGLGLVPQGRRIFSLLTVEENLRIAARGGAEGPWNYTTVCELLPILAERSQQLAGNLSGGEQQMLAIGRAVIGNPRMLLLDEPFEGLAPLIVDQISDVLAELRRRGIPALLVEQKVEVALALASRVLVMDRGEIVHEATAEHMRDDPELTRSLLGIA